MIFILWLLGKGAVCDDSNFAGDRITYWPRFLTIRTINFVSTMMTLWPLVLILQQQGGVTPILSNVATSVKVKSQVISQRTCYQRNNYNL